MNKQPFREIQNIDTDYAQPGGNTNDSFAKYIQRDSFSHVGAVSVESKK